MQCCKHIQLKKRLHPTQTSNNTATHNAITPANLHPNIPAIKHKIGVALMGRDHPLHYY